MKSIKLLITTSLLAIPFYEANANANLQYEVVSPQFQSQVQTLKCDHDNQFRYYKRTCFMPFRKILDRIFSAISVAVTQSSAGATQIVMQEKKCSTRLGNSDPSNRSTR